jgi:hypothetical protein
MTFVGGHDRHSTKKVQRRLIRWDTLQVGAEDMEDLRPRFGLCSESATVMCRLWITPKTLRNRLGGILLR